jgi:hypothetical protein
MSKTEVPTMLKLWKDSGLHEVLQGYPKATAVRYFKNYTAEVLEGAFKYTMSALKEGRLQKRDATLMESACKYATGVARRNSEDLEVIQKEIDKAQAKENVYVITESRTQRNERINKEIEAKENDDAITI